MGRSILVLNAGSSSLKYSLFSVKEALSLAVHGLVEQIGSSQGNVTHTVLDEGSKVIREADSFPDHKGALQKVVSLLHMTKDESKAIMAVGHRVVHGGEAVSKPLLVDEELKRAIERASPLAPLHNPPNLQGIRVAEQLFACPQVAVFDTAFHSSIPPRAFTYALPYSWYTDLGIRRYGFHGTSYLFLVEEAAQMLQKPKEELNLICLHLGAGASMAAIEKGKCIDTTMGVTPLEGLVMATRSGDMDPAIHNVLHNLKGVTPAEMDTILNKKSGLFGICGEKDVRHILDKAGKGDSLCQLALEVFVYRIRKYLGAYLVHLQGKVDAIVFSAGIGEHSAPVRKLICDGLDAFGIEIDNVKNETTRKVRQEIQVEGAKVKLLVIPTDEELCIAQQTLSVVEDLERRESGRGG
eukprot:TRINITY_DN15761_c0_g1_i1.p1 TRINITY_DN15761_c0_g1~~TRINITY_DN15761_c0_g1_i1.p1  ORF type:complete len:410 (-),score=77.09 TRINITY_DN15761_c0_g1_i1:671-1900(-)